MQRVPTTRVARSCSTLTYYYCSVSCEHRSHVGSVIRTRATTPHDVSKPLTVTSSARYETEHLSSTVPTSVYVELTTVCACLCDSGQEFTLPSQSLSTMQSLQQHAELSASAFSPQSEPFHFPLSPSSPGWLHDDSHSCWPLSSPLISADTSPACNSSSPLPPSATDLLATVAAESAAPVAVAGLSPSPPPSSSVTAGGGVTEPRPPGIVRVLSKPHRDTDTRRRRKENAMVRRLDQLCQSGAAAATYQDGGDESRAAPIAPSHRRRQQRERKRAKLSVLEACAGRIERLEELLHASELANSTSEAQVRLLNDEIGAMVARERLNMQKLHAADVLHGAGMLHIRFACTLVECRTGRLVDANSAFYTMTGFSPCGVLQRVLHPTSSTPPNDLPLVRAKRISNSDGRSDARGQQQWVPRETCRQFPGTARLLEEMKSGQRDSFRGPYRCRWLDGQSHPYPSQRRTAQRCPPTSAHSSLRPCRFAALRLCVRDTGKLLCGGRGVGARGGWQCVEAAADVWLLVVVGREQRRGRQAGNGRRVDMTRY